MTKTPEQLKLLGQELGKDIKTQDRVAQKQNREIPFCFGQTISTKSS